MRALLFDKADSTLIAIEVAESVYDRNENKLYLYTYLDTCYVVEKIIESNANSALCELYSQGKTDLTQYSAYVEEDE